MALDFSGAADFGSDSATFDPSSEMQAFEGRIYPNIFAKAGIRAILIMIGRVA